MFSVIACRCLAQEVWIGPLAGRFLRLVLQLLARFCSWLSGGLEAREAGEAAARHPAAGLGEVGTTGHGWAIGTRLDHLCSLRADMEKLLSWLESDYSPQLISMLPSSHREVWKAQLTATFCLGHKSSV